MKQRLALLCCLSLTALPAHAAKFSVASVNSDLVLETGSTSSTTSEALRVTTTGLVAVGGTSVQAVDAFNMAGNNNILISSTSTDGGQLEWRTAGSPRHYNIDQISIGTNSPQLRFFSEDNANDGNGKLEFVFISSSMAIGGMGTPTAAVDVSGSVKATAFSGDGSALTNVSVGCTPVNVQTFTTPGTDTWEKPSCGTVAYMECWGGGGGGGGGKYNGSAGYGSGGGGGAYVARLFPLAWLGTTETVTVASGGTAGATTPSNGGYGGNSSVGALLTAPGGMGGAAGNGAAGAFTAGAGNGGDGGQGSGAGRPPGVGGCGGSGGNGGNGQRGDNAGSPSGCGGTGGTGSAGNTGGAGSAPGGGGGGGGASGSGTSRAGGAGGRGQCRVTVM